MAFIHTFREIELMLRHRGAFGAVLGTHHPPIDVDGARLSMSRYTIPARLARARDRTLPLGAILALFDEISTLNLVAVDRGRRPGVSVALSAWRAARAPLPRAGATVAIESRVERCGRTLGFCEVALRDAESGAELARGRHVKFLPMGAVFDVMTRPALLPLALRALAAREPAGARRAADDAAAAMSSIDDAVPLEALEALDGRAARARLARAPALCNPMGSLHGGALCVAAEAVAASARARAAEPRFMSASFLAAGRGALTVAAREVTPAVAEVDVTTADGKRAFEAQLVWGEGEGADR